MIHTIVEGCMPDTPGKLMYCGIGAEIPENARIVLSDHELHPNRYLLYARTDNSSGLEMVPSPNFDFNLNEQDPNKLFSGGWPIRKFVSNFRWIFDAQRSLTTRDGRIFIEATYFHQSWTWYLRAVPKILEECGAIFRGEKTEEHFYNNPGSAFGY